MESDLNRFKENTIIRIENLMEDNQKLHKKCDEFYKNNCSLRKEINDLIQIMSGYKEKIYEIHEYYSELNQNQSNLENRLTEIESKVKLNIESIDSVLKMLNYS